MELKEFCKKHKVKIISGALIITLLGGGTVGYKLANMSNEKDVEPTPQPTVSATVTPTPSVIQTPEITPTPSETVIPSEQPSVTPSPSVKPSEQPGVTPSPSVTPSEQPVKPSPSVKPSEQPVKPSPSIKPSEQPSVTPSATSTPDLSKEYQAIAQTIISNSKKSISKIKTDKDYILTCINSLKTSYTTLRNDRDDLKKLIEEANKLVSSSPKSIKAKLQSSVDEMNNELSILEKKLEEMLNLTDKLIKGYDGLNISSIEGKILALEKSVPNVKKEEDLNTYYELEKEINILLSEYNNTINQYNNSNKDKNYSLANAQKDLANMKDVIKEYNKNNSGSGGSTLVPPKEPSNDTTYDDNGNIDDSKDRDEETPLPEPSEDDAVEMKPTPDSPTKTEVTEQATTSISDETIASLNGRSYTLTYTTRNIC